MTKTLVPLLCLALIAISSACVDEPDDAADDQLRPQKAPCPICKIKTDKIYLSLSDEYDPSYLIGVSVLLSNSSATELIDYGTTVSVPNEPDIVVVTDSELCTVGTSQQPPTTAYVEFELSAAGGSYTVGNGIPISAVCQ